MSTVLVPTSGPPVVAVVGDANPDLVLRGDVTPIFGQAEQLIDEADLVLGGSAAIVAHGLARLGVPTMLVSVIGDDPFGGLVQAWLTDVGVDVTAVRTLPGRRTGLSVILSRTDDRAILTLPGTIPDLDLDPIPDPGVDVEVDGDTAGSLPRSVRHVHVASPFLQPELLRQLPALLAQWQREGRSTSLDPNWDPTGQWRGIEAALAHLDILLPNRRELLALSAALTGSPREASATDLDQAAGTLTKYGVNVVMKDGADGGRAWHPPGGGDDQVCVPPADAPGRRYVKDVVDTTGAGDSFDAGYLAGRQTGLDPDTCLRWAVAAGTLSTRGVGGTATQPTAGELAQTVAGRW
jgi:ribokinase